MTVRFDWRFRVAMFMMPTLDFLRLPIPWLYRFYRWGIGGMHVYVDGIEDPELRDHMVEETFQRVSR